LEVSQVRLPLAILALLWLTSSALTESKFDGLWKRAPIVLPDGTVVDPYACFEESDGTIPINGNRYEDAESNCTMSNARNVRGMDAILYDVTCRGEWGSRTQRALLILYRGSGDRERLLMVKPNGAAEFERCN
jgi:hypothetical protein